MNIPLLCSITLALAAPLATAQNLQVADDGTLVPPEMVGTGPAAEVPGSLTTHFNGGNGFAGNCFDITPIVDMEITGMDFHARYAARQSDIDVYYRVGTSVGFEQDATAWTLLASGSNTNTNGPGMGSFVDLSGNGVTFAAGTLCGIYMDNVNYSVSGGISYTNGVTTPEVYRNNDLVLEAYTGTRSPAFSGGAPFSPRVWNGTLYYEAGAAGPSLSVANLTAGSTCTLSVAGAGPGATCIIAYSVVGGGPTSTPVGDVDLSLPIRQLPSISADANGDASLSASVPPHVGGISVWIQAVDLSGPTLTNSLAEVIG